LGKYNDSLSNLRNRLTKIVSQSLKSIAAVNATREKKTEED